jgi:gliding motility-associated-like protein
MTNKTGWMAIAIVLLQSLSLKAFDQQFQNNDSLWIEVVPERYLLDVVDQQQFSLCNLLPGERYLLYYNKDLTNLPGQVLLQAVDAKAIALEDMGIHAFAFTANADCVQFVSKLIGANTKLPLMISLDYLSSDQTCKNIVTDLEKSMMPIVTNNTYTPQQLVQDVFVGGNCFSVDAASISYTGAPQSIGYFSNGTTSVNMETGVMLLTGNIATAVGPNNLNNAGTSTFSTISDPDLADLIPNNGLLRDVTTLEFDFTPTTDNISFEFVFASEEYCEYVNSQFNDVFGFFISGPGINGPFSSNATNIALIPGTNANIAINDVNHNTNTAYYINNMTATQILGLSSDPDCDGQPAVNGFAVNNFQFDGLTTVLTASSAVVPCESYHIKLVIADVGDAYFDSAVFFKANSFDAGGNATVDIQSPNANVPNTVFENCAAEGFFTFRRTNDDLTTPLPVFFNIAPQSTATPGLDFAALPSSITIPAGDSVFYLPVDVFTDGLAEGQETIILELETSCSCDMPFVQMQIADQEPLEVSIAGAVVCDNASSVTLSPQVSGGMPGYQYLWSNNATTPTIEVISNNTTTYSVTVTDLCGNEMISAADIMVIPLPTATISGYEQICPDAMMANLQVAFTGIGPWDFSYSVNNAAPIDINNITDNPYILQTNDPGIFTLTAVAENGCEGTVQGVATVEAISLNLTSSTSPVSCPSLNDGSISVQVSNGQAPYNYAWDNPLAIGQNPDNLPAGNYNLLVTDANGCTVTLSETVVLTPDVPTASAGTANDFTCAVTQLTLAGTGSTGAMYSPNWSTTNGNILNGNNTFTPTINQPGTYVLTVTNVQTGCSVTDALTVNIDTLSPVASVDVLGPLMLDCEETSTVLSGTGSLPFGQIAFYWSTTDGFIPLNQTDLPVIEVEAPGTYQLEVMNINTGCMDMEEMVISQSVDLPIVNIAGPLTLTCLVLQTNIDATNSSTGVNFEYLWSTPNGNILSGSNTLNLLVNEPGQYNITITNNINGCTQEGSITVEENITPPIADAGPTPEELDCNTEAVSLNGENSSAGSSFSYSWTSADGNILSGNNSLTPTVNAGGTYLLTVINQVNGCESNDVVTVEENPIMPNGMRIAVTAPLCHGDRGALAIEQVFGGAMPFVFSIDGGNTFYGDTLFVNLVPGNVQVIVQDVNGCQFEMSTLIPDVMPLQLELEAEASISLGDSYQIEAFTNVPAGEIDTIIWSPDETLDCSNCLDPLARPLESTLYGIILLDTNGCLVEAEILLRVDKERDLFIPNAFSPNGDGNNDLFMIFANNKSIKAVNELQLFNRWGEKVFQKNDFMPNDTNYGWNGYFKGELVNPSVLVYFAEVEFIDGFKKLYKGDVTLMK